ncbi:dynamin-like GTPase mgm1, partial [Steccherinum ochraceum]
MLSAFRRRLSFALGPNKSATYGLRTPSPPSRSSRPVDKQFSTLLTSQSLRTRSRNAPGQAPLRHVHIRALSYSSIPRFMLRALRVPVGAATAGVGGVTYANYKFEEVRKKSTEWINAVQETATDIFDSASDTFKAASAKVSDLKLPELETPQFLKDLFSSSGSGKENGQRGEEGGSGSKHPQPEGEDAAAIAA